MESSTGLHPGDAYLDAWSRNIDFACVKSCIFTHMMCAWPQTWLSSFQLLITSSLYHNSTFWPVGCIWIGRYTRTILSLFHFLRPIACELNFGLSDPMGICDAYVLYEYTLTKTTFVVDVHHWLTRQSVLRSLHLSFSEFSTPSFPINSGLLNPKTKLLTSILLPTQIMYQLYI